MSGVMQALLMGKTGPVFAEWKVKSSDQDMGTSTTDDNELVVPLEANTNYLVECMTRNRHVSLVGYFSIHFSGTTTFAAGYTVEGNHTGETTPVSQNLSYDALVNGEIDSTPVEVNILGSAGTASFDRRGAVFIIKVGASSGILTLRGRVQSTPYPRGRGSWMRVRQLP